ncbi:unnamed protein product [Ceutorhynchus assimilis]|uniref:Uncharacterized protein n=1 Tax=Ceutorhynchus assimilis TaxID=467358 RepID=A0A9N9MJG3_9CUCU|nr:unnamed protein product [Ceutorhynchus assimilis]
MTSKNCTNCIWNHDNILRNLVNSNPGFNNNNWDQQNHNVTVPNLVTAISSLQEFSDKLSRGQIDNIMKDVESKTKGRGNRGRARGIVPQQRAAAPKLLRPQQGALPQHTPPIQPGLPCVWDARVPGAQPQQQAGWAARPPAPEITHPTSISLGRGSRLGGPEGQQVTSEASKEGSDVDNSQTRLGGSGNVRGCTNRTEIISTKPVNCKTKKGSDGTVIQLKANYFQLISATKWSLNQYRVDFNPSIEDTRTRKKLVANGIRPFNVTGYLFDGTVLYTPNRLYPEPCEFVSQDERSQENIKVEIRLVGEVHWGDYHYLQVFNVIIRKCFNYMNFQLLGRNYFDPNLKVSIRDHNLELWPGFLTSMKQYEQNIMLNVDLSFKVLRTDTVYDLLLECGSNHDPRQEFLKRVIGSIVLTEYNNRTYRIDDVVFNKNPDHTFTKRDNTQISFRKYFQERYQVNIQHNDQPLLISKSKAREIRSGMPELVVLLPELCIMTGLSDKQRGNLQLMRAMSEHTRVNAGDRMRKLLQFAERLRACPAALEEIRRWDLKLAENLIEFQGRVLPAESLLLRDNQPIQGGEEVDWTRNLRTAPMYNVVNIDKLAIIAPSRVAQAAQEFGQMLSQAGKGMSMIINSKVFIIPDDRINSYLSEIEKVHAQVKPSMVMVVLTNNSGDRYNGIKKKCYIDNALPCQVILARNLTCKGPMSIATKVAIQMNCKMGGAPWAISLPKNTMVVGFDVCRDTAERSKSFAGMVASIDQACTQYYSMVTEHEFEQELSSNIANFMLLACKRFQQINKVIPDRIVVYRDGVGDGQIQYVKEYEVEMIKTRLAEELYKEVPLQMAVIIVSKRINTKIFRSQASQRNDFNVPPGTVVDDVITWPERYDFYIVSQCVRQGTATPTSYNVIEDTLGIDANKLQRFTYKMCHMYFNWSGTVRVPAPCQYAHKLSFLTAQSLHRAASSALSNTLYYL